MAIALHLLCLISSRTQQGAAIGGWVRQKKASRVAVLHIHAQIYLLTWVREHLSRSDYSKEVRKENESTLQRSPVYCLHRVGEEGEEVG